MVVAVLEVQRVDAAVDEVAGGLEKASIGKAAAAEKPPVKPLAEANRTLGFGGDDDDF